MTSGPCPDIASHGAVNILDVAIVLQAYRM
jgi:hypothetical protein